MAKEVVGLGIDIESDSVKVASDRLDGLAKSSKDAADGAKGAMASSEGLAGKVASVGTKAGVAVAAVTALVTGVVALGSKARETARELNQQLLDAIEDAARGSEDATEQFEDLENAMRNIRGRTDLLARGYDNLEEATESATEEFARNEAIVRDLDRILPRFKDAVANLAMQGYAALRREAVEANEALIQTEIAVETAQQALERLSEAFSSGFGVDRVAGVLENLRTDSDAVRDGLTLLAAEFGEAESAELRALATTQTFNRALDFVIGNLERSGQITAEARDEIRAYTRTVEGRNEVMLLLQGTIEEQDSLERALAMAIDTGTDAVVEQASAADGLAVAWGAVGSATTEAAAAAAEAYDLMNTLSDKRAESLAFEIQLEKELRAIEGARKEEGAEKLAEALGQTEEAFMTLESVGSSALSGLSSSLQNLSVGALVEGDEDALQNFGKSLGTMLVQLGTMAVAYAAVAALGTIFPALGAVVGPATGAPALAAAGLGAIAAGAGLGAATKGKTQSTEPTQSNPQSSGPTTTQNIYNVTFDSLTPARARNRAMVEGLGSSIESAA